MQLIETQDALSERPEADPDDLIVAIEREVEQAACGQVAGLSVIRVGDAIVLRGRSRTYHASQLAHQAVLDLVGDSAQVVDLILVS